ncbi:MAG: carboxypeptidase M32, partial [Candidatus Omnitrophica bacterium]|nr:carboxypeptidase M32 [Candidatus Omnitrophota bacterium]
MTADHALKDLREKLGELNDVAAALSILHWDQQTYMPPKAGEGRGKQIATLSALRHRMFVSSEISDLLSELRGSIDSLAPDDRVLVEETAYDFDRATKLPEKFVQELAQTESDAFEAWVKAKKGSNFSLFQPHLEKLVDLQRQKSDYLGYEGDPYNALLEIYERGMTAEKVAEVFTAIGKAQGDLVHAISESTQLHFPWLDQEWKQKGQWDFGMKILANIGYDLHAGRQDLSEHPFTTTFGFHDVRVTTRVHEDDLFSALMSTLHEGGHALYEQGFLEKDARTPLAEAPSLGIHESQSRMWENMVGRSLPFWEHYLPDLKTAFPGQLDSVTAQDVYRAINRVQRSLIRVEADECTYNLHIILRFELERAMLSGDLKVADLPGAWNEKMMKYLGVDVPDDAH